MTSRPTPHEPLKPKAYSYLRFSTPEQRKGDSYRRQTELAEQWAAAHGYDLDAELRMSDEGVSAFRAKNIRQGALGQFLRSIDDGLVPVGSILLVEALDRVSRADPWEALPVFQQIINAGVTIVTLKDQRTWSRAELRTQPHRIYELIANISTSNIESVNKQFRLRKTWAAKRAGATRKKLTSTAPAWLRLNKASDQFEVIEERGAVVARIYQMAAVGKGLQTIANTLNEDGVATFSRSAFWNRSYICKVLDNPAATGLFVPCVQEPRDDHRRVRIPQHDEAVPGYFPSVVDQDTYERVRAMRSTNSAAPKARIAHMLAGLARCPHCGGSMKRENKGGRSTTAYYVCSRALHKAGCKRKGVRQDRVEEALRSNADYIVGTAPSGDQSHEALVSQVNALDDAISSTHDAIDNAVAAITRRPSAALSTRLASLEASLRDLQQEREKLLERDTLMLSPLLQRRFDELEPALARDDVQRANAILRQLFEAVEVDYPNGRLNLHWRHSDKVTSVTFAWPIENEPEFTASV